MASAVSHPAPSSDGLASARPATQIEPPTWCPKVDNPPANIPQEGKKKKRKSRKGKGVAKRGATALPANRGTGFEGECQKGKHREARD